MDDKRNDRYYRIGDFARYMGVTPDFLKHYEQHGLLRVAHTESGYRYYHFDQSSRILEYMRLRSYGVSVREMGAMLSASDADAIVLLDEKAEKLRKDLAFLEAVIEEHQRVKRWYEERCRRPSDWEVREVEPHVFLPHSCNQDFIKDERIYELLKSWVGWMPVVKSALRVVPAAAADRPDSVYWGLMIPESIARKHGIPVNDAVVRMPAGKAFIFNFLSREKAFDMASIALGKHPMFRRMAELGLRPRGSFYLIVEMKLTEADGSRRGGAGRFVVPLAGSYDGSAEEAPASAAAP